MTRRRPQRPQTPPARDVIRGKNAEGYQDPTAATALYNVERSRRGQQSRLAGEIFENMIDAALRWYEDLGLACVEKTPEPMRPLARPNSKGQFLACYTKAAQPDYKGTIKGGRSVVFEAKHTDGDRIQANRLTPEQADRLERHPRLGAAAFVVVSFGLSSFYRIPWEVWRDMRKTYGRAYIKQEELEGYKLTQASGAIWLLEGIGLKYNEKEADT